MCCISYLHFRSGSMRHKDRKPLARGPATDRIRLRADNRLGAVYSALYSFWSARHTAVIASQQQQAVSTRSGVDEIYSALCKYSLWSGSSPPIADQQIARRDAYSVILFSGSAKTMLVNDFTSSPDQLLNSLLGEEAGSGTNFALALRAGQSVMLKNWSAERPVT
jgi:hypothetical protein